MNYWLLVLGLFVFPQEAWVSQMVSGPKMSWQAVLKQSSYVASVEYLGSIPVKLSRPQGKPFSSVAHRFRPLNWITYGKSMSEGVHLVPSSQYHTDVAVEGLPVKRGDPKSAAEFYVIDVSQFLLEDGFERGAPAVDRSAQMREPPELAVGRKYVFLSSSYNSAQKFFEGGPSKSLVDGQQLDEVKRIQGGAR